MKTRQKPLFVTLPSPFGAAALASLLALLGCGEQTEGERCDPANESGDCASGLSCVPLSELHRGTTGAVCCPRRNATEDICLQVDFGDDGSGEPPASTIPTTSASATPTAAASDAGPADAGPADAGPADAGPRPSDGGVELDAASTSDSALTPEGEGILDLAASDGAVDASQGH